MDKFVIEREMPGAGSMTHDDLRDAARKSSEVLAALAPRVQWQHSYVTADKVYCVYLAEDEEAIREHGLRSGFPVTTISRVTQRVDPTTGDG